jgi:hypothetical protein
VCIASRNTVQRSVGPLNDIHSPFDLESSTLMPSNDDTCANAAAPSCIASCLPYCSFVCINHILSCLSHMMKCMSEIHYIHWFETVELTLSTQSDTLHNRLKQLSHSFLFISTELKVNVVCWVTIVIHVTNNSICII